MQTDQKNQAEEDLRVLEQLSKCNLGNDDWVRGERLRHTNEKERLALRASVMDDKLVMDVSDDEEDYEDEDEGDVDDSNEDKSNEDEYEYEGDSQDEEEEEDSDGDKEGNQEGGQMITD